MKDGMRIALLTSGGATTAREIIRACKDGRLQNVNPVVFVTSNPDAGGVDKAIAEGLQDIVVVRRRDYATPEKFGEHLLAVCHSRGIDAIGQYGWLLLTPPNVIQAFEGRILNQHPGPLRPNGLDFGGKGMYGRRVHCARLAFVRETRRNFWTEVVTHRVTPEYDKGVVVRMRRVEILRADDVDTLQKRCLPIEHEVQVEALDDLANNRCRAVSLDPLVDIKERNLLMRMRELAIHLYPNG